MTRRYTKTGFYTQVAKLKRAVPEVDRRSKEHRFKEAWKQAVTQDLGGDLSAAQKTLLDVAGTDLILLSCADSWLQAHPERILNRRKGSFVPLVAERVRVAAHLQSLLTALGLERRAVPTLTLAQLMDATSKEASPVASPDEEV